MQGPFLSFWKKKGHMIQILSGFSQNLLTQSDRRFREWHNKGWKCFWIIQWEQRIFYNEPIRSLEWVASKCCSSSRIYLQSNRYVSKIIFKGCTRWYYIIDSSLVYTCTAANNLIDNLVILCPFLLIIFRYW